MKVIPKLIALTAVALSGVACQSNKTASSDPYNTAGQAYGGSAGGADPYASSGEYDNVYASGGGQSYGGASAYGGAPSYGSDDYYTQAPQQPAYNPPSYQQPSYEAPSYSGGGSTAGSTSHTVRKGDTLFNISRRYGTTVNELRRANGINGDLIRIGETLVIP